MTIGIYGFNGDLCKTYLPTKHITSEDIIASGIDLPGFLASSPVVAIISKPMNA